MLKDELEQVADVDQVAVYHNADAQALPESVVERITAGTIDWITITSPAITARLHELLPRVCPLPNWPRDSACELEPCDDRGGTVRGMDRRGRSG